jgi:WhiB family redox-sensing transcriptional regulator
VTDSVRFLRLPADYEGPRLGVAAPAWQRYANCLGVDPDLFFPERGGSTREAKEVCRGCVVREECLEYAIEAGEKFGIWGGLSERERRTLRRRRNAGYRVSRAS